MGRRWHHKVQIKGVAERALTIHSSRTRFAGRLNSGVRAHMTLKRLLFSFLVAALLGSCATSTTRSQMEPIRTGVAAAIKESSVDNYLKTNCLDSLKHADSEETALPQLDLRPTTDSAMFFLGSGWLTFSSVFVGTRNSRPTMTYQDSDTSRQAAISSDEFSRLMQLIGAAKYDAPPKQPSSATDQPCTVFRDSAGQYFLVSFDTTQGSSRATDLAYEFVEKYLDNAP